MQTRSFQFCVVVFVVVLWRSYEMRGVETKTKSRTNVYFSVVLFIMLYKVVLTFESVDEIL